MSEERLDLSPAELAKFRRNCRRRLNSTYRKIALQLFQKAELTTVDESLKRIIVLAGKGINPACYYQSTIRPIDIPSLELPVIETEFQRCLCLLRKDDESPIQESEDLGYHHQSTVTAIPEIIQQESSDNSNWNSDDYDTAANLVSPMQAKTPEQLTKSTVTAIPEAIQQESSDYSN